MKKKILSLALILILISAMFVLTGCGETTTEESSSSSKSQETEEEEIVEEDENAVSADESYVGYYADVDGDGTVDGIIYVDLMDLENTSGEWRR